MKKMNIISFILVVLFSFPLGAAGTDTISIQSPENYNLTLCPSAKWPSKKTIVWKGLHDTRSEKAIGSQSKKKGEDVTEVVNDTPIENILNEQVLQLLKSCGLKLVTGPQKEKDYDEVTYELEAELLKFFIGVKKGLITGEATSEAEIQFQYTTGNQTKSFSVGIENTSKKMRHKNLKQLEKAANDLLKDLLQEVSKSSEFEKVK